jgi:methylmalonyl-CoA mutase N-terminal domain/subunit
MVGVNDFVTEAAVDIPILKIDPEVERQQIRRVRDLKQTRDNNRVRGALEALAGASDRRENVMPYVLEAVRAYATVQEISDAMKAVLGSYREPAFV